MLPGLAVTTSANSSTRCFPIKGLLHQGPKIGAGAFGDVHVGFLRCCAPSSLAPASAATAAAAAAGPAPMAHSPSPPPPPPPPSNGDTEKKDSKREKKNDKKDKKDKAPPLLHASPSLASIEMQEWSELVAQATANNSTHPAATSASTINSNTSRDDTIVMAVPVALKHVGCRNDGGDARRWAEMHPANEVRVLCHLSSLGPSAMLPPSTTPPPPPPNGSGIVHAAATNVPSCPIPVPLPPSVEADIQSLRFVLHTMTQIEDRRRQTAAARKQQQQQQNNHNNSNSIDVFKSFILVTEYCAGGDLHRAMQLYASAASTTDTMLNAATIFSCSSSPSSCCVNTANLAVEGKYVEGAQARSKEDSGGGKGATTGAPTGIIIRNAALAQGVLTPPLCTGASEPQRPLHAHGDHPCPPSGADDNNGEDDRQHSSNNNNNNKYTDDDVWDEKDRCRYRLASGASPLLEAQHAILTRAAAAMDAMTGTSGTDSTTIAATHAAAYLPLAVHERHLRHNDVLRRLSRYTTCHTPWFPESLARRLMRQLLSGLASLQRAGILHRDLKPENIFLDRLNLFEAEVRIGDFGLAKDFGASSANKAAAAASAAPAPAAAVSGSNPSSKTGGAEADEDDDCDHDASLNNTTAGGGRSNASTKSPLQHTTALHCGNMAYKAPERLALAATTATASNANKKNLVVTPAALGAGTAAATGAANVPAPAQALHRRLHERAHRHYSYNSDVWAAGIIFFEMLCGCRPWSMAETTEAEYLCRILRVLPTRSTRTHTATVTGTTTTTNDDEDNDEDLVLEDDDEELFPMPVRLLLSRGAKRVVVRALTADPQRRPCAEELLKDPWFAAYDDDDVIDKENGSQMMCLDRRPAPQPPHNTVTTIAGAPPAGVMAMASSPSSASPPPSPPPPAPPVFGGVTCYRHWTELIPNCQTPPPEKQQGSEKQAPVFLLLDLRPDPRYRPPTNTVTTKNNANASKTAKQHPHPHPSTDHVQTAGNLIISARDNPFLLMLDAAAAAGISPLLAVATTTTTTTTTKTSEKRSVSDAPCVLPMSLRAVGDAHAAFAKALFGGNTSTAVVLGRVPALSFSSSGGAFSSSSSSVPALCWQPLERHSLLPISSSAAPSQSTNSHVDDAELPAFGAVRVVRRSALVPPPSASGGANNPFSSGSPHRALSPSSPSPTACTSLSAHMRFLLAAAWGAAAAAGAGVSSEATALTAMASNGLAATLHAGIARDPYHIPWTVDNTSGVTATNVRRWYCGIRHGGLGYGGALGAITSGLDESKKGGGKGDSSESAASALVRRWRDFGLSATDSGANQSVYAEMSASTSSAKTAAATPDPLLPFAEWKRALVAHADAMAVPLDGSGHEDKGTRDTARHREGQVLKWLPPQWQHDDLATVAAQCPLSGFDGDDNDDVDTSEAATSHSQQQRQRLLAFDIFTAVTRLRAQHYLHQQSSAFPVSGPIISSVHSTTFSGGAGAGVAAAASSALPTEVFEHHFTAPTAAWWEQLLKYMTQHSNNSNGQGGSSNNIHKARSPGGSTTVVPPMAPAPTPAPAPIPRRLGLPMAESTASLWNLPGTGGQQQYRPTPTTSMTTPHQQDDNLDHHPRVAAVDGWMPPSTSSSSGDHDAALPHATHQQPHSPHTLLPARIESTQGGFVTLPAFDLLVTTTTSSGSTAATETAMEKKMTAHFLLPLPHTAKPFTPPNNTSTVLSPAAANAAVQHNASTAAVEFFDSLARFTRDYNQRWRAAAATSATASRTSNDTGGGFSASSSGLVEFSVVDDQEKKSSLSNSSNNNHDKKKTDTTRKNYFYLQCTSDLYEWGTLTDYLREWTACTVAAASDGGGGGGGGDVMEHEHYDNDGGDLHKNNKNRNTGKKNKKASTVAAVDAGSAPSFAQARAVFEKGEGPTTATTGGPTTKKSGTSSSSSNRKGAFSDARLATLRALLPVVAAVRTLLRIAAARDPVAYQSGCSGAGVFANNTTNNMGELKDESLSRDDDTPSPDDDPLTLLHEYRRLTAALDASYAEDADGGGLDDAAWLMWTVLLDKQRPLFVPTTNGKVELLTLQQQQGVTAPPQLTQATPADALEKLLAELLQNNSSSSLSSPANREAGTTAQALLEGLNQVLAASSTGTVAGIGALSTPLSNFRLDPTMILVRQRRRRHDGSSQSSSQSHPSSSGTCSLSPLVDVECALALHLLPAVRAHAAEMLLAPLTVPMVCAARTVQQLLWDHNNAVTRLASNSCGNVNDAASGEAAGDVVAASVLTASKPMHSGDRDWGPLRLPYNDNTHHHQQHQQRYHVLDRAGRAHTAKKNIIFRHQQQQHQQINAMNVALSPAVAAAVFRTAAHRAEQLHRLLFDGTVWTLLIEATATTQTFTAAAKGQRPQEKKMLQPVSARAASRPPLAQTLITILNHGGSEEVEKKKDDDCVDLRHVLPDVLRSAATALLAVAAANGEKGGGGGGGGGSSSSSGVCDAAATTTEINASVWASGRSHELASAIAATTAAAAGAHALVDAIATMTTTMTTATTAATTTTTTGSGVSGGSTGPFRPLCALLAGALVAATQQQEERRAAEGGNDVEKEAAEALAVPRRAVAGSVLWALDSPRNLFGFSSTTTRPDHSMERREKIMEPETGNKTMTEPTPLRREDVSSSSSRDDSEPGVNAASSTTSTDSTRGASTATNRPHDIAATTTTATAPPATTTLAAGGLLHHHALADAVASPSEEGVSVWVLIDAAKTVYTELCHHRHGQQQHSLPQIQRQPSTGGVGGTSGGDAETRDSLHHHHHHHHHKVSSNGGGSAGIVGGSSASPSAGGGSARPSTQPLRPLLPSPSLNSDATSSSVFAGAPPPPLSAMPPTTTTTTATTTTTPSPALSATSTSDLNMPPPPAAGTGGAGPVAAGNGDGGSNANSSSLPVASRVLLLLKAHQWAVTAVRAAEVGIKRHSLLSPPGSPHSIKKERGKGATTSANAATASVNTAGVEDKEERGKNGENVVQNTDAVFCYATCEGLRHDACAPRVQVTSMLTASQTLASMESDAISSSTTAHATTVHLAAVRALETAQQVAASLRQVILAWVPAMQSLSLPNKATLLLSQQAATRAIVDAPSAPSVSHANTDEGNVEDDNTSDGGGPMQDGLGRTPTTTGSTTVGGGGGSSGFLFVDDAPSPFPAPNGNGNSRRRRHSSSVTVAAAGDDETPNASTKQNTEDTNKNTNNTTNYTAVATDTIGVSPAPSLAAKSPPWDVLLVQRALALAREGAMIEALHLTKMRASPPTTGSSFSVSTHHHHHHGSSFGGGGGVGGSPPLSGSSMKGSRDSIACLSLASTGHHQQQHSHRRHQPSPPLAPITAGSMTSDHHLHPHPHTGSGMQPLTLQALLAQTMAPEKIAEAAACYARATALFTIALGPLGPKQQQRQKKNAGSMISSNNIHKDLNAHASSNGSPLLRSHGASTVLEYLRATVAPGAAARCAALEGILNDRM